MLRKSLFLFPDEDFKPNQDSDDDEETIEKEEQDLDVVLYVSVHLMSVGKFSLMSVSFFCPWKVSPQSLIGSA